MILKREVPRVFAPLLKPARYKGAHGGRGSGKSHFFAEQLIEDSLYQPGLLSVCIREVQQTLKQSSKRLIEKKIQDLRVGDQFKVWYDRIETPGDGLIAFQGMADHTAESIKSLEGFGRAWIEEAQTLSVRSLTLLRPTIRAEGSEIWAGWNPRRKVDAIDAFLRAQDLPGSIVVEANWRDNPWFPKVLDDERLLDLEKYPERYDHIWEGGYAKAFEGAYFAKQLNEARLQGRIGRVPADPLMTIRLFADIGGTGARADSFTFWAAQFIGREIRVLNYYEAVGQPIEAHVAWLRAQGYTPEKAQIWLPHDGVKQDAVHDASYAGAFRGLGYEVTVVPNQGAGAAGLRIEAARRLFPSMWFNEASTEAGRDALGFYHERKDENRGVGLGPEHDWSSHGADSFGLMSVVYEAPKKQNKTLILPAFGAV